MNIDEVKVQQGNKSKQKKNTTNSIHQAHNMVPGEGTEGGKGEKIVEQVCIWKLAATFLHEHNTSCGSWVVYRKCVRK